MTHTSELSNPRHCPHSMVTDLCGLCIRDRQIKTLEQQNAALSEQVAELVGALKQIAESEPNLGGLDKPTEFAIADAYKWMVARIKTIAKAAIAKAGSHE